jgi:hypothetical protein
MSTAQEKQKPKEKPTGPPNPDEIDQNTKTATKYIMAKNKAQKQIDDDEAPQPMNAEHETPRAAETKKDVAKENAEVQRDAGSQFPMPNMRPQPPSSVKEEGSVIVAKGLAEQLGTSPELKAEMRIDERKMAVLSDTTLAALSHFSYRFVYDGVRYWGHITEWWLTGSQGIGGLGRRHILQALANTSGVQVMDKAEKPNAVARNIWDRNWKKKAEQEGKVTED